MTNGTAFHGISGKEDNFARCTANYGNFLTATSVPFDFHPGTDFLDFRLGGSLFVKIQQFPDFLEPVISVPFAPVSKFSEFLVE